MTSSKSGVSSQDSVGHSFYPIRLIFGYVMGNCQAYQRPKFHVRSFLAFGCALEKGSIFPFFWPKRAENVGSGIRNRFYRISHQKTRFLSIPAFRYFLPFSRGSKTQLCMAQMEFFKSFGWRFVPHLVGHHPGGPGIDIWQHSDPHRRIL